VFKVHVDSKVDRSRDQVGNPSHSKGICAIITGIRAVALYFLEGGDIAVASETGSKGLE